MLTAMEELTPQVIGALEPYVDMGGQDDAIDDGALDSPLIEGFRGQPSRPLLKSKKSPDINTDLNTDRTPANAPFKHNGKPPLIEIH